VVDLSPNAVVLQLLELARELQKLSDELDGLEERAVEAKEVHTVAYAKTFLDQSGSVEERKQRSMWLTADERLAAELAEAMVKAQRRKIDTLRTRIDIGRSAAALVRAESELLNVRGRGG
jgi:arginyl-tRNA synthetase